jgi:hypothetical protein
MPLVPGRPDNPEAFRFLFPADQVRAAKIGAAPPADEPRDGHVWPIAAVLGLDEQPTVMIEMAFFPAGDLPEPMAPESWTKYCEDAGLAPFVGEASLHAAPGEVWRVDFGPHMYLTNPARPYEMSLARPEAKWEEAVRAHGSCSVVLGTGFGVDDESGAVAIPKNAAAVTPRYVGSRPVPELLDIPGLHVVPVNSFQPYDPKRPVTFILDTDVLIDMERFCFEPAKLGDRAERIRYVLVNLAGRDVLPGPALAQLLHPTRTTTNRRAALKALAAFKLLAPLSRAEVMQEREPAIFDESFSADLEGVSSIPQMFVMYAGVLRLRHLWGPSQTLAERAQSFESFMLWLRDDLRLNAGLLMQVAFNLWMADEDAKNQASRLLHFRAGAVSDETLGRLWGTAYDLFLVGGQADTMRIVEVPEAVILTFDSGLAGMRDFFEHVGVAELAAEGVESGYAWNSRVKMNFHPRLEHMRPRVTGLAAELHLDMLKRLRQPRSLARFRADLLALVEREEQIVKQSP